MKQVVTKFVNSHCDSSDWLISTDDTLYLIVFYSIFF